MLFFFEEYRFASKLVKRQQQLQAALSRAEAIQLPEPIVEMYRLTLAAHEAVQQEIVRLGNMAFASFGEEGNAFRDGKFARYKERAEALGRDVEAFEKQRSVATGPSLDPQSVERQFELEERRIALEGERLALVRGLGVGQGVATFVAGLYDRLQTEVLDFEMAATRKRLGIQGVDAGVKAGTDVLLPGAGILRDFSDALDRYFDGQMVEDDKAQAHYLWLDTYRQAAESWIALVRGFLKLVPEVPD